MNVSTKKRHKGVCVGDTVHDKRHGAGVVTGIYRGKVSKDDAPTWRYHVTFVAAGIGRHLPPTIVMAERIVKRRVK